MCNRTKWYGGWRAVIICIGASALFACGSGSSGNGAKIQFTASGEVLALGGYAYPPADSRAAAFVDGWEVKFSKLIVTIDKISLWTNPDTSPTDQSMVGQKVAQLDGPWAIDLHKGGPLVGKGGGGEQAFPIATLDNQNLNGNKSFDPTGRYAFGFDIVPATASAKRLQLDATDPDYQEMIANGYSVLYVGTATWRGNGSGPLCRSSISSFDFARLPQIVNFRLGFKTPTSYVNCQNPDNDPARGVGVEAHQRGIQVKVNDTVIAQVTVHSDHPFWDSFVHDSPAHFDQLAAVAIGPGPSIFQVTTQEAVGVNYTGFKFGTTPLPWRACLPSYALPSGQMGFDSGTIQYNPNPTADPTRYLRDYADYMAYNQSTQGHLNSDGLCFVQRRYPSPP
jgi:hypothetical protein